MVNGVHEAGWYNEKNVEISDHSDSDHGSFVA